MLLQAQLLTLLPVCAVRLEAAQALLLLLLLLLGLGLGRGVGDGEMQSGQQVAGVAQEVGG